MFSLEFLVDVRNDNRDNPMMRRFRVVVGDHEVCAYVRFDDILGEPVWGRVLAGELESDGRRQIAPLRESRIIALAFQRYHDRAQLAVDGVLVPIDKSGTSPNGTPIFDIGIPRRP